MSKGRIYTVVFTNVSVAAIQDLFELTAADDKPIEIMALNISQSTIGDAGDAQEEFLRFEIIRGNTTSGTGGTAPVPRATCPTDAAAGFTAEANNVTTQGSAGTPVTLWSDGFNVRAGYQYVWPEGTEPETNQAAGLLRVALLAAPVDPIGFSATLTVRERG